MNSNTNEIGLSFDVEDWFTVRNMRDIISYNLWDKMEQRIENGIDFILKELKIRQIKATFFILGWTAQRSPHIVSKIARDGHEIATHGYNHKPLDLMNELEFERDLVKSLEAIVNACDIIPKGYRAPSFSITKKTFWALDILRRNGISYDSSIFPIAHPDYGIIDFEQKIQVINDIVEVPLHNYNFMGTNIPIAGGGYFRLLPYFFTRKLMLSALKKHYMLMYFHPWEFDEEQPRMNLPKIKRFRHYVGLNSNRAKFKNLLDDFKFVTIEKLIEKNMLALVQKNVIAGTLE